MTTPPEDPRGLFDDYFDEKPIAGESSAEPRPEDFRRLASEVVANGPVKVSVETLLDWFGFSRRTTSARTLIDAALLESGLETSPRYDSVWIKSEVEVRLFAEADGATPGTNSAESSSPGGSPEPAGAGEPSKNLAASVPTIGTLEAASREPECVSPDTLVSKAATLLLLSGFSQVPVMIGSRTLKGFISWKTIGEARSRGKPCRTVAECMGVPCVVSASTPILSCTDKVIQHEFVLVRQPDNTVRGPVTAGDIAKHLRTQTEPYLLLGQIEELLRRLIVEAGFSTPVLATYKDPSDRTRSIETSADLTLGELQRLLQSRKNWEQVSVKRLDRSVFLNSFEEVCRIRNDVMHFCPDPLAESDLGILRRFAALLHGFFGKSTK